LSVETLKPEKNESDSKALAEKLKQIVEKLQKVSHEPATREFRADTELVKFVNSLLI